MRASAHRRNGRSGCSAARAASSSPTEEESPAATMPRESNTPSDMASVDVTGRPITLRALDLERLLRPKVIALVGASDSPGSQSALNTQILSRWCEQLGRRLIPVNPNRQAVAGE